MLGLTLIAAPPSLPRGEWYDLYLDGLEAIEEGRPAEAVAMIRGALELRSKGGYFRTYGNNYIRYAPHAYLGVAHHDAGSCDDALAAFERAERDGEADGEPALASRMRSLASACRARIEAAARPAAATPAPTPPGEPAPPDPQTPLLRPVDRQPFERGVSAYLAGDFQAAAAEFSSAARLAPESAVARLLLAAALDGLAATGAQPETSLKRCRDELRVAVRLDPRVQADPRYFSPRLLRLLEESR